VPAGDELRAFLARMLGWSNERAVDLALLSLALALDHAWVRVHAAASLTDIEKATLRLVAIRTSRNLSGAAARLGMAMVSLSRLRGRRKLPPMMLPDHGSHR